MNPVFWAGVLTGIALGALAAFVGAMLAERSAR